MTGFADQVQAFAVKARATVDETLRAVALELLSRLVLRSPVGNPELWASNHHAQEGRDEILARAVGTGESVNKARLQKLFPFATGKGYVGGRFRGNWQVTLGVPSTQPLDRIDANGGRTITVGEGVLEDAQSGVTIYILNNLPYSERLENGWSKQVPAGVVKVTVAEFQAIVDQVTKEASP